MKNIIVIGGGGRFQELFRSRKYRDYKISAIFDNDPHKHGIRLNGIPVLPLEKISSYEYEKAIVTPRGCKWRLSKQLMDLNVPHGKIEYYHNENDLDRFLSVDAEGILTAEIDGIRLAVRHASDEMIINEVLLDEGYQFHWGGTNAKHIVVDIGMNVGIASLYFARQDAVKKVYGFEPFSNPYESAIKNFQLNEKFANKIISTHCGLSDKNLQVEVPFNRDWITASRTFFSDLPQNVIEEIELRDAGSEIKRIRSIEGKDKTYIVKIDCEGSEYEVFKSLEQNGELDHIDLILGETHDSRENEIFECLERHSFHYFYRRISQTQCIFKAVHASR